MFTAWSHDYPLSIDDVKLRFKNWVEIFPKGPGEEDVNAIENEFFTLRGKGKTCQFLDKKVLDLYLSITYSLRNDIENHIESEELKTISVCY